MEKPKASTVAKAALLTAMCPLFVVVFAPFTAWLITLIATAGRGIVSAKIIPFGDGALQAYLAYSVQLVDTGHGYVLACLVAAYIGIIVAVWTKSKRDNPDRDVFGGVLGKERSVRDPRSLLRACEAWDGKSSPACGVSLGFVRGRALIFECTHAVICAPSGSGKTRRSVYMTADALSFDGENNLLFTDPSMEIYATTVEGLRARGYEVKLLDFENPRQGARYNPLKLIIDLHRAGDDAAAIDRANEVGATLYPTTGGENDIFASAAGGAFAAVAYTVATSPEVPDAMRNLASVADTLVAGTYAGSAPLKDWLRSFGPSSPQVAMAAVFLASEGKMESSILGSIHDGLRPFTVPNMRWMTSASELDVDGMLAGRTATFLHTLGPGSQANRVASLFLAQHWAETQRLGRRRGLRPFWVIGDEWHSLPRFDLVHALEQARKYGLHYVMYLQSFSGLDQYRTQREDGKDAILVNCDVKALYSTRSDLDAQYFEKLGGFKTVRVMNEGEQRRGVSRDGSSRGLSEQKVPVWPAGETLSRNPATDGALVYQAASGPRAAGRYEVPTADAGETFVAEHFGTLGTREFEKVSMNRVFDELEERAAGVSLEVESWTPDFAQAAGEAAEGPESTEDAISADEFAVWDR